MQYPICVPTALEIVISANFIKLFNLERKHTSKRFPAVTITQLLFRYNETISSFKASNQYSDTNTVSKSLRLELIKVINS